MRPISERHRTGAHWLFALAVGAAVFVWSSDPDRIDKVYGTVSCDFVAEPNQPAIRLGNYTAPLVDLRLEGELSDPFQRRKFELAGRAEYEIGGLELQADARGSFFLDDDGNVLGLFLIVEDEAFGGDGLNVLTLNDDGVLDYSDDTAYAYSHREFRMSHPLAMNCSVSGFISPPEPDSATSTTRAAPLPMVR